MQYYMFVHYILQRGKDTNMFTHKLKKLFYAACCRRVHNSFLCVSFVRNCVSVQLQFDHSSHHCITINGSITASACFILPASYYNGGGCDPNILIT